MDKNRSQHVIHMRMCSYANIESHLMTCRINHAFTCAQLQSAKFQRITHIVQNPLFLVFKFIGHKIIQIMLIRIKTFNQTKPFYRGIEFEPNVLNVFQSSHFVKSTRSNCVCNSCKARNVLAFTNQSRICHK